MHIHFFSSFLIIIFITLMHVPTYLCADEEQYLNCSKQVECANIQNIGYPFWGFRGRPQYCGRSGFRLNCQGDAPEITISATSYRILAINSTSNSLTVARAGDWNTAKCPNNLVNTTLDFSHFSYTSSTQNLTLYYDCSTDILGLSGQFFCSRNDTNVTGYYATSSVIISNITNISACNKNVIVPVFESAVVAIENNSASTNILSQALNGGFGLQWSANHGWCDECVRSGGQCGSSSGLNSSDQFTCYCRNGAHALTCEGAGRSSGVKFWIKITIGILVGVAGIIVASTIVICCLKQAQKSGKTVVFWKKETENNRNIEAFIKNNGSLTLKRYSYSDVKKMTKSLTEKLGQGGYGGVYKGKLSDGRLVAVKVLSESKGNGEEFMNEVASISRTSHVNIVTLLGFCYEGTKRALIYEFMPNGSLDKFIYDEGSPNGNRHLEWKTLYQIAIGIARGLEYLHRGCNTRILHFDIKPHNILLDEDFCPKVSDFGLAKLCQKKESIISMLGTRGTIGYIAPEVFSRNFGGVSHKSDVYSYGMMVLEMVGGKKNIDPGVSHSSEIYFPHWIYEPLKLGKDLKLHGVVTEVEKEITRKMILVSLWCIQTNPSDRPSMTKVVEMLEGNLHSLQIPPKPCLSSPPRSPQQYSSSTSTLS